MNHHGYMYTNNTTTHGQSYEHDPNTCIPRTVATAVSVPAVSNHVTTVVQVGNTIGYLDVFIDNHSGG